MVAIAQGPVSSRPGRVDLLRRVYEREPRMAALGTFLLFLAVPTLVAHALDGRAIAGVSVWMKPLKFEVSLSLYAFTLALAAHALPERMLRSRRYDLYMQLVVAAVLAEMAWLIYAAAIGQPSHFNRSDPLLSGIYALMGVVAVFLTSATLVYGVAIGRNSDSTLPPAAKAGLAQGIVLTFFLTVAVAGFMAGGEGHLVGGNVSDSEALPLLGWARDGGDLRVAHFFAAHAVQVIPLFGFMAAALFGSVRTYPVAIFSTFYAGLVIYSLVEALDGRPFLAWLA